MQSPGWNSSVTAAPPTTARRSTTFTFKPARARSKAQTKPVWPAPTITTSELASALMKTSVAPWGPGPAPAGARRAAIVGSPAARVKPLI